MPDDVLFPFIHGVHWHPSWGNLLPFWPRPWAVPALAIMSFFYQVCCHPVLSQNSEVLFIFFFNNSDFSELQLERDGLVPRSSITAFEQELSKGPTQQSYSHILSQIDGEGWTFPGLMPSHLLSLLRAELLPGASQFSKTFLLCLCVSTFQRSAVCF